MLLALKSVAVTPSVSLAWDSSSDSSVVGYKIYYGTNSHDYTTVVDVGNVTTALINLPAFGQTYYFAATTYDATGLESDFSSEANYLVSPNVVSPTLSAIGNVSISGTAGQQTVNLSGISAGSGNSVTVTATSSNPGLIHNPTVTYTSPNATGSLKFTPATNATGSAIITVTVNNGKSQNNLAIQTFTVNVTATSYNAPTLAAIGNVSVTGLTSPQIVSLSGITTGNGSSVKLTATSSNPALIPNPAVNYTSPSSIGSLTFTVATNISGTATITVTANNSQSQNNLATQTFTVTVAKVYQSPSLSAIGNVAISGTAGQQTVSFSSIKPGSGQKLTVTAISSNPGLIPNPTVTYTSPNTTGSLKFAPATNATGSAIITVTVNNGQPQQNLASQMFIVNVTSVYIPPVNHPPTLDPIAATTLKFNPPLQTVILSGISSGSPSEFQPLTVKAVSSNTKVIPNPSVTYSSPLSTGTLTFKSVANVSGSVVITVTVNDGSKSNNVVKRTFKVTVKSKAASIDPPELVAQPKNQVVLTGKTATFKVSASGPGTLKYQWKKNGVNIVGAVSATLTVKSCSAKSAGRFTVSVSNTGGAILSAPAALVVSSTPTALLAPISDSNINNPGTFSFNVQGVTGDHYAVESSPDMVHWTSVQTNTAPFDFVDPNAGAQVRQFYRTVYVPVP